MVEAIEVGRGVKLSCAVVEHVAASFSVPCMAMQNTALTTAQATASTATRHKSPAVSGSRTIVKRVGAIEKSPVIP